MNPLKSSLLFKHSPKAIKVIAVRMDVTACPDHLACQQQPAKVYNTYRCLARQDRQAHPVNPACPVYQ